MSEQAFDLVLELEEGYRFRVDFDLDGVPPLVLDEPPPLGAGEGPNPARLLAAAVGDCLSASALYCLRKARVPVRGMRTEVRTELGRNEAGRLRIAGLAVTVRPDVPEADRARTARCLDLFEDFCIVTESVRRGVPVDVRVELEEEAPAGMTG